MYREYTLHFPSRRDEDHTQDRLQITHEDFASCFPYISMDVQVMWESQMPVTLIITRSLHGTVTSVETYQRKIIFTEPFGNREYDPYVECIRQIQHKKYYRTQRYDYLPKWKEINDN